ncbi:MAG: serine hydrolase [Planctomycetota bacterium]|nr:serine hydrolase [Planctomycetota bacterium]
MSLFRSITPYPMARVTTRWHHQEVDPRDVGLSKGVVDSIWRGVESLYRTRAHPAISFSLRRHGKVVLQGALGHEQGNAPGDSSETPKKLATPDSLFNLFSASKPITAMIIHHLDDLGTLHVDDPVAEFIPEFARHGKGAITLRHLLNHRSGLPSISGHELYEVVGSREALISRLCKLKLRQVPGRKLAYEAILGGFLLGEVVERTTGKNLRQWFRENVGDRMGFKSFNFGVERDQLSQVVPNVFTGPRVPWPFTQSFQSAFGLSLEEAVTISNTDRFLSSVVPWGNVIGTADEASQFFQLLLDDGRFGDQEIFHPKTVRRALLEQSYLERDQTLGYPMRYSMGFMLGSQYLSFFGKETTRLFGHLGLMNIFVFADPERDISVCLMTNGKPFLYPGLVHWFRFLRSINQLVPRMTSKRPIAIS